MRPFLTRLVLFGLVLTVALEILFRTMIPASDKPFTSSEPTFNIFHYRDAVGETGTFSAGRLAEIRARWSINNAGWNSTVDYVPRPERTRPLIAILGNSYVEGLHVDVDQNLASQLRRTARGSFDVYGFGIPDAPFAHNIQLARYVNATFDPDIVIIINNGDRILTSLVSSGRMPLYYQLAGDTTPFREVQPKARTVNKIRRFLSSSALVRYLALNSRIRPNLSRPGHGAAIVETTLEASSAPAKDNETESKGQVIQHVLSTLLAENDGRELLVVMDAHRWSMYTPRGPKQTVESRLMGETCEELAIPFVDLSAPFRSRWESNGFRFEFPDEYHWNTHGHRVVAEIIAEQLSEIHQPAEVARTRGAERETLRGSRISLDH